MSGNWLDSSKNSNLFIQSYIQGFLDISGGNLLLRNNNLIVTGGDASLNGRLTVTRDASLNGRLFIAGDASLNGRLFVAGDASLNGRLFVNSAYVGGTLITKILVSDTSSNSRLGTNTLQSSAGTNNTGSGYNAGTTNITGSNNTFLGATSNTTGTAFNQSTALGYGAQIIGSNQIILGTNTEKTVIMGDTSISGNNVVGMDSSFGGNLIMNGNATISTGTTFTVTGTSTGVFGELLTTSTSNIPSTNTATYGKNWSIIPGTSTSAAYTSVSLSSTGQYILYSSLNKLYLSNNYGLAFSNLFTIPSTITSTSISSTGQYQLASANGGATYLSTNYGTSYNAISIAGITSGAFGETSISSTGQYQIVATSPGSIYISNTYGTTFTQNIYGASTSAAYTSTSISSAGQYVLASANPGALYLSTNYGSSFTTIPALSTANFTSTSISSTGQYMLTSTTAGLNYLSSNYGQTFTNQFSIPQIAGRSSTGTLYGSQMTTNYLYVIAGTASNTSGTTIPAASVAAGQACLNYPFRTFVDSTGIYIADSVNNRVTFVSKTNQYLWGSSMSANYLYLLAGTTSNTAGTTLPAASVAAGQACLNAPRGVFVDSTGLYIGEQSNSRVTFISRTNQYVWGSSMSANYLYLIAGTTTGTGGVGIMGAAAAGQSVLQVTEGVYGDAYGIYIGEYTSNRVTFVSRTNQYVWGSSMSANYIYLLAGTTTGTGGVGTMGIAAAGQPVCTTPRGVYSDDYGLYIADGGYSRITFISRTNQYLWGSSMSANYIYLIAGITGSTGGGVGTMGIPAVGQVAISGVYGLFGDNYGIYIADYGNNRVTFVSKTNQFLFGSSMSAGYIYLLIGNGSAGTGTMGIAALGQACLNGPSGVSVDSTGIYVTDYNNNRIVFVPFLFPLSPPATSTAISATGQYQLITSNGSTGSVYLSQNYGQTFTANPTGTPSSVNYQTTAISSTGKYMIAAANPGAVYLSSPPLVSTPTTLLSGMVTLTDLSMTGNLYSPSIVTSQVAQSTTTLSNFGVTWQNSATTTRTGLLAAINLYGTAISGTGQYQLISWDIETMYLSSNYGTTWTRLLVGGTTNYGVSIVAMSFTGQYMIGLPGSTTYYLSNNFGATFTAYTAPVAFNGNPVISSTGQYMMACNNGGALYISYNYGLNWTASPGTGLPTASSWMRCAGISSTGQYMLAGGLNTPTYLSSNYGASWSICSNGLPTAADTRAGSVSSSGQYMLTAYNGGYIYVSSDYGNSWRQRTSVTGAYWGSGQSMSSTGQYMLVPQYGGPISYSTNYGQTWTNTATNVSSLSVAMSSNAQYTLVGQNNGSLWWSVATMSQSTNIYPFTNIKGYVGFTDSSGSVTGADAKALVEINGVGNLTQTYQNALYTDNYSLYTSGSVLIGQNLNVASDRRIKTNIQDVVDVSALSVIRQLKPKRYNYIDTANRGVQPVWGYIAQEVKAIVDYAVNETTDYVPNIYSVVTISGNTLILPPKTYMVTQYDESGNPLPETEYTDPNMPTTDNFTKNQNETPIQIKLIDIQSKRVIITTIINIQDEQTIIIADDLSQYETLFLYGQRVTDFNVLDKNAVFTIATAALQEVDLELQETKAQVQELANDLALIRGTYGSPRTPLP